MQIWKVELVPEAQADFNTLDGSVKKHVLKQLIKLEQNPNYGDPLGNKAGINLDGYFKLYADKKQIRIIYEVVGDIIKVIAIDKREDLEVYRIALKRILSMKQNLERKWGRKFFGHALDFAQRGEQHNAAKVLKGFGGESRGKIFTGDAE